MLDWSAMIEAGSTLLLLFTNPRDVVTAEAYTLSFYGHVQRADD